MTREMKNSGVQWIGNIPSNWGVFPVYKFYHDRIFLNLDYEYQRAFKFNYGTLKYKDEQGDLEYYRDTYIKYSKVKKNDIVINGLNLNYDFISQRVAITPEDGIITSAYIVMRPYDDIVHNYFCYVFKAMDNMKLFHGMGKGIRLTLSFDELKRQKICVPPLSEQKAIADFLDAKCVEIDGLLSDLDAEVKTLAEYKKSLIAETVTHGLNPNVPMKQINLGWIDEVPGNWSIARIASLYTVRNEKVSDQDFMPLSVTMKGIVPQLDNAAKTKHGDDRKLIRKGDFVINSRSDRRGSCGISPYDGSCSLINTVLAPREAMNPEYYDWLFHTTIFADEFYKWGYGIVNDLWTTNWGAMRRIQIPVPPIQEQAEIAAFLNEKIPQLDKTIADKTTQIETLKAYKASLIYEYVTGKKQVAL